MAFRLRPEILDPASSVHHQDTLYSVLRDCTDEQVADLLREHVVKTYGDDHPLVPILDEAWARLYRSAREGRTRPIKKPVCFLIV